MVHTVAWTDSQRPGNPVPSIPQTSVLGGLALVFIFAPTVCEHWFLSQ